MMELLTYTPLWWLLLVLPVLAAGLWWSLVDRPRKLRAASFALRTAGVVLLVLALCRPFVSTANDDLHVAFIVDVSQSVDLDAAHEATGAVRDAIDELEPGDSWSLFALGRSLRWFDSPEALAEQIDAWRETPDEAFRSATAIADGLRGARLAMPGGKARRIVLLSDGQPTGPAVEPALAVLRDERIDVRLHEIAGLAHPEAAVVALEPSTRSAFKGQLVRLTARLASNTDMAGELRIVHRGAVVARETVALEQGPRNRVSVDVAMHTPGESVWTAELVPERDHFAINNRASTTIDVRGEPRVLVLHERPRLMRDFARAMEQQEIAVELRPPHGMPERMEELLAFDALVMADVPSSALSARQMHMVQQYVSDFGGGVAMLGSENSFGLGGYYRTPVEEVLPLVSRFEQEREQPSMAMVLVIDKSGSMSGVPIALARQAAKGAVGMLSERDQVGVVSFDSQAQIVSELRHASDRSTIQAEIDRIAAGGGTYMYAGMVEARRMLERAHAKVRHMIVLGDGMTQPADHEGLVEEMVAQRMTVSMVALGPHADRPLMSRLAELGKGRYYETMDPSHVPQIFTHETIQASRSAIQEDVFASVQVGDHPMLAGYERVDLPFTLGYVMTQSRPTAQVVLATDTGDPLLAVSRFGLGHGLAFTGDLTRRWGAQWLAWPEFSSFWSQAVRAIVRQRDSRGLEVRQHVDDGRWRVEIQRTTDAGDPLPHIQWDAVLLDGAGRREAVRIDEIGLGRYAAEIDINDRSRLTLRLHDVDHDRLKTVRHEQPYPEEYRLDRQVPESLARVAGFSLEDVRDGIDPVHRREPASHLAILLAIVCLIAGVALRRV